MQANGVALSKHLGSWENSGKLCKPLTVSNSSK